jgi:predicted dinucleotide-binding enzyme
MKIGVLGTGDVGKVLAAGLTSRGHDVMIGTRDPSQQKLSEWVKQAGRGVENVIQLASPDNFAGKVVIDTTNPLRFEAEGQLPVLAIGHTDSAGEVVQRLLPEANVVKAFNIVGNPHMVAPDFPDGKPDMFICGNDSDAKQKVGELIESLGWPPVIDLGGIESARYLEPLAMVWITHFFLNEFNGNHAFKLLRK